MVRQKRIAAISQHKAKQNEAKKRTEAIRANLSKQQQAQPKPAGSSVYYSNRLLEEGAGTV